MIVREHGNKTKARLELFKIVFKISDSILGVISKIRIKLVVFSSQE